MNISIICSVLFLFIFSFPIIGPLNSSHISMLLIITYSACNIDSWKYLKKITSSYIFLFTLLLLILFSIYSILITLLLYQYDFTIIKTIINNLISFIICVLFVSLLFYKNNKKDISLDKIFVSILIAQSVIIITMLISPDIRYFIQSFIRTDEELRRMAVYDGVRGLGLSGSIAFGLAITMGLLSLIFMKWISENKSISIFLKFTLFLISFIASLSAGRTAILGYLLGCTFFLSRKVKITSLINLLLSICYMSLIIGICIYLLNDNEYLHKVANRYINYAFQPILNFINTGSFSVSSLNSLNNMYFFPENTSTWFIGDGKYTSDEGFYYKNTDSGYMRFLLFFGIIGSLIPYFGFLFFCFYVIKKSKESRLLFSLVIIMALIFHYKAEVIFFNVAYMKIIYIYGFYYIYKQFFKNKTI
ncbi:hypothetical protein AB7078_12335 [Proteus mirabilis]|uniref:hypothetical protein n=2 Tax=Proteus mirabilis TaxID=584 RepID=UPI0034E64654